ncbi:MAG: metallophosphoesterase [Evtepia sp.]
MALYVMGDPHLSLGTQKPMDIFGGAWQDYLPKLTEGLSALTPDDTIVLCGDISWGMSLEESLADFSFLDKMPGRKILLKGNHDYWWTTVAKMEQFFAAHQFHTFEILHNNCCDYQGIALCGTRGWSEDTKNVDQKVFKRELIRLESSLKAAGDREKICFLHYPPCYEGYRCEPMIEILEKYRVTRCFYGHLHGLSHRLAIQGKRGNVLYRLISADYLKFKPEKICD